MPRRRFDPLPVRAHRLTLALAGAASLGCVAQTPNPPTPAQAAERALPGGTGWFDCVADSECVLVSDPSCHYTSVNRDRAAEFTAWIAADLAARGALEACPPWSIDYAPLCLAGKCSSTRTE